MPTVSVATAHAPYTIQVERGSVRHVAALAAAAGVRPTAVAVVADAAVEAQQGAAVQGAWTAAGVRAVRVSMQATEDTKSLATVEDLCQRMLRDGLDRSSCVTAVGGGVVGDTAGLAAALFMRGVAWVQVPTTLLGMVDAAVGGKTAVNLSMHGGGLAKNMIGAFWQPRLVVCDPETLATLPVRELRCGLAECVKHAVLADPALLTWMEERADPILAADPATMEALVARSVAIKAAIVARDERETGERAHLNLGHTFAHAIEALDHAHVKHGEAVAIGLVAAAHLGGDAHLKAAVTRALRRLGLPTALPNALPVGALVRAMHADKKSVAGALRLVVPQALGTVAVQTGVPEAAVQAAWMAVGAAPGT
ncbi:MAG: 3-dehydroquinate synthase [Phycisphaerales bacterium]